jgi:hypothetical protein
VRMDPDIRPSVGAGNLLICPATGAARRLLTERRWQQDLAAANGTDKLLFLSTESAPSVTRRRSRRSPDCEIRDSSHSPVSEWLCLVQFRILKTSRGVLAAWCEYVLSHSVHTNCVGVHQHILQISPGANSTWIHLLRHPLGQSPGNNNEVAPAN